MKLILACLIALSGSIFAMQTAEKNLADELEQKCNISPQISRKRANSPVLEFDETFTKLLKETEEKRAKKQRETQLKIQNGQLILYRIQVQSSDFNEIYKLDAIIKKIIHHPHQQLLATVDLLVMAEKENALITHPIVKSFTRLLKYETNKN